MGSLVMTSTHAPDVGLQHPYSHRIMVDSDQYESDRPSDSQQRARDRPRDATSSDGHDVPHSAAATAPAAASAGAGAAATAPAPAAATRPRQPYHPHNAGQQRHLPPPASDSGGGGVAGPSPSSPRLLPTYRSARSLAGSEATSPSRIKVRDLSHIQSFASEEYLSQRLHRRTASTFSDSGRQYEISSMPVTDIIEMVAGLLTKITATNDRQHEHVHRPMAPPDDHASMQPQANCVLAFHGKNVPSITILSYLSRIHKYCPATYEVFLSLLVYFDRMTELVNASLLRSMQRASIDPAPPASRSASSSTTTSASTTTTTATATAAAAALAITTAATTASPPTAAATSSPSTPHSPQSTPVEDNTTPQIPAAPPGIGAPDPLSQFFVVDSYNIHRLIIAGVTCASKFFSDVFYTNSRYAKVGGLPLVELNHLELQFLILNDFRLSIPVEELEAYGTMLVEFYAREIVAQQQQQQQQQNPLPHHSPALVSPVSPSASEAMYMREATRGGQPSR